jgi:hypothetical protein
LSTELDHGVGVTPRMMSMAIFGDCRASPLRDGTRRDTHDQMRVSGLILGMVVVVASARAEADPEATESPSVAGGHDSVMLGGAIALGLQSDIDFRVGWMVNPRVAVFATGLWSESITDNDSSRRLLGVGARLWISDRAFLEGRLGQGIVRSHVSPGDVMPGDVMMETKGAGGFAGLGVEVLQQRHFGLEFHFEGIYTAGEGALAGGLGFTFY